VKKESLLPYSTSQFVFWVFLIYASQRILGTLAGFARASGVPYRVSVSLFSWGLGRLANYYYAWHLFPLLIILYIVFNNISLNPHPKIEKVFAVYLNPTWIYYSLTLLCLTFMGYLGFSILQRGFNSCFTFFDYRVYNLGLLIYVPIALYLLRLFRHENFFKMLIVIVLGVQMVSDLWELPLNLFWHHDTHILLYTLGTFQRLAIPLLFWFYTFRKTYSATFRSRWFLMVPLMLLAAGLTLARLFFVMEGMPCFSVLMSLHIVYAFLLIFVPFHYYTCEERKK